MPVTAKLSRRFYETFGDDIANELVEWFNQVDATYRSDLRELNELNFARFDAKVEQRFAEFESRVEQRFTELRSYVDTRITGLEAKWDQRFLALDAKIDERVLSLRAEMIKWMFVFWIGTLAPLAGLIFALTR